MALISSNGYAHVRLTVTDIERSKKFYDELFGWPKAIDSSASVDEPGVTEDPEQFYGGVVYQTPQGTLFGLRPVGSVTFDSTTTGLDHVSFAVDSRSDLVTAVETLEANGVAHDEIKDIGTGYILEFRDPDNIALELFAPKAEPSAS